jgi:hypothetical protein
MLNKSIYWTISLNRELYGINVVFLQKNIADSKLKTLCTKINDMNTYEQL